jgi:hypothetical protein
VLFSLCEGRNLAEVGAKLVGAGESIKFKDTSGDYLVAVDDEQIKIECYLPGSPTGGYGTECFHTIGREKVSGFLEEMGVPSLKMVLRKLESYSAKEWSEFHQLVMRHQTKSFVWNETNWDD